MTENMAVISQYKGVDVYLIYKEGQYWIAFANPNNQNYWVKTLNGIMENRPLYKMKADIGVEGGELEIDMLTFKPILDEVNRFLRIAI
jgi:hypothetical protein